MADMCCTSQKTVTASGIFSGIGFDEVEAVRAMLAPDGPRAVNLSGNHFIRRRTGVLSAA